MTRFKTGFLTWLLNQLARLTAYLVQLLHHASESTRLEGADLPAMPSHWEQYALPPAPPRHWLDYVQKTAPEFAQSIRTSDQAPMESQLKASPSVEYAAQADKPEQSASQSSTLPQSSLRIRTVIQPPTAYNARKMPESSQAPQVADTEDTRLDESGLGQTRLNKTNHPMRKSDIHLASHSAKVSTVTASETQASHKRMQAIQTSPTQQAESELELSSSPKPYRRQASPNLTTRTLEKRQPHTESESRESIVSPKQEPYLRQTPKQVIHHHADSVFDPFATNFLPDERALKPSRPQIVQAPPMPEAEARALDDVELEMSEGNWADIIDTPYNEEAPVSQDYATWLRSERLKREQRGENRWNG